MRQLVWIILVGIAAALLYGIIAMRRRWAERERASEERFAAFMSKTLPQKEAPAAAPLVAPVAPQAARPAAPVAAPRTDAAASHQQLLLLEAAGKAGEAGEAALSIQLYARLLARYPDSALAGQARAAVEEQKRRLGKP
jgi:hypothetical protein